MNGQIDNDNPGEKKLGQGMLYISWIIAFALLTLFTSSWLDSRDNPNRMPEASSADGVNEVILERNYQHHYVTNGQINDSEVTLLIDTGATHVSIPQHVARELGLQEGIRGYAQTANGTVEVSATVINKLDIGSITLYDVRASINPGMEQDEILLGMSALKNIEFTHRNGVLTLKQYY